MTRKNNKGRVVRGAFEKATDIRMSSFFTHNYCGLLSSQLNDEALHKTMNVSNLAVFLQNKKKA